MMAEKFLLHKVRLGPGICHSLNCWNLGYSLSRELGMTWIPSVSIPPNEFPLHCYLPRDFLSFFGLSGEIKNEEFEKITSDDMISVPDDIQARPGVTGCDGLRDYLKKHINKCDVFFLKDRAMQLSRWSPEASSWFRERKEKIKTNNLCVEGAYNISIAIRRGDCAIDPNNGNRPQIQSDEWHLDMLEEACKNITSSKPKNIMIFSEGYQPSLPSSFKDRSKGGGEEMLKDMKPEAAELLKIYLAGGYDSIKNIYLDEFGRPSDIKSKFSKFNPKLYLNTDPFEAIETWIQSDLLIADKLHGTARVPKFLYPSTKTYPGSGNFARPSSEEYLANS